MTDNERLAQVRHDWDSGIRSFVWDRDDIGALLRLLDAKDREIAALRADRDAQERDKDDAREQWINGEMRLSAERDAALAALRPFVKTISVFIGDLRHAKPTTPVDVYGVTKGDVDRARAALDTAPSSTTGE